MSLSAHRAELFRADATRHGFDGGGAFGKRLQLSHLCSLRSPDRKQGKIRRSPPTESADIKVLRTLGFFAGRRAIDIKVLRTLAFFAVLRAIDMQVFTDLKRFCFSDVAPSPRNAPPV